MNRTLFPTTRRSFLNPLLWLLAVLLLGMPAVAADVELANVEVLGSQLTFEPLIPFDTVRVNVVGPSGFEVTRMFNHDDVAAIDLPQLDGLYKYELRFGPLLDEETRGALAQSRRDGTPPPDLGDAIFGDMTVSGAFSIAQGTLVQSLAEVPASGKGGLDKVVLTNANGVVRNALCVGFDCPDAPTFGDSSVLMMENNNRIKFGDTSNSPFPNNDWEIEANSNLSGGANYLGFNDCGTADNDGSCAADLVFAVESGVRQNALRVESDGDVGLGTANPVVNLHIVDGNSPTLRLDQDTSSGFASQVWDIAGNETSFFIRDATNGSTLPFRVFPGAPSNSLAVSNDGDVGIGTISPDAHLDIENNGSFAFFRLTASTAAPNTAADMTFTDAGADGAFRINIVDGDDQEFEVDADGNVTIDGEITTASGTSPFPDYVFESDYPLMPLDELAKFVESNKHLPSIPSAGDIEADGGRLNMTAMQLKLLEKVEELTLYAIHQDRALAEQQQVIDELRQRLAGLETGEN